MLANLIPAKDYVHGTEPTSIDAGIMASSPIIYFYDVDTPLKQFVASRENILRHCRDVHQLVTAQQR